MVLIKERIGKMLEYLKDQIYPDKEPVPAYKMLKTCEKFKNVAALDTSGWEDFTDGQIWGGHREYYWFAAKVKIPERFQGKTVVYELLTGREGAWDATNPQFSIYVDGKLIQGLDVNHREIILTEKAEGGEKYSIVLSAFTGDQNFSLRLDSSLKVLDRKTEKYFYDLSVPYETARLLNPQDQAYITIIQALNESLNLLDMRREGSETYYQSLEKAQDYIDREFYEKYCGKETAPVAFCVGHTHIDCAWLWTLKVTEDKAVRSFSTVLNLMKEYPEYIFMSSQPQLYLYVKKNAPKVYEEIKERVKEGRWEPEGGMFVEADCNLASGESLIRQFIYGKRFFKEEFGKDSEILWLPDVFGYSAALPQIMEKCGIRYFMTTKISWNEFNKMPYDTFMWEGIDGTRILTHFVPTRDYNKAAVEGGTETEHFTTYNGYLNPSQIKGGWARYSQKELNREYLCSFGFGDGGGGPTRDMLENQRRMAKGIPGCPVTKISDAEGFFHVLDKKTRGSKNLPLWVGELYLEYHRGTYTSMARNKRYNRKSELAYQNEETFAMMDRLLSGGSYPKEKLREGWQEILLNQFHDILPGSSIKEVYEDSQKAYEKILENSREMTEASLKNLTSHIDSPRHSVAVFNPNSFETAGIVSFTCPETIENPSLWDGECEIPVQRTENRTYIFTAQGVPSKGYKIYKLKDTGTEKSSFMNISTEYMDNQFFHIVFNEKGQFARIWDKTAEREVLKEGQAGNVIISYEDRPHNYDAWDLNNYYTEKSWEVDDVSSIKVTENGPVRGCVRVERRYLESLIVQDIYIYQDIPRIDIANHIDWREHQIFVKDHFPIDVHTNEAVFDIQFGNVKRNTHDNTSWDFAKFEVCHHKWLDVSEEGYGVSILNDCKYGVSVRGTDIGLSMLKSGIYPNPEADQEHHEFIYSIFPHRGSWKESGTVAQAYELNNPMKAVVKENQGGSLRERYSLLRTNLDNVVIETAKMGEEDETLVVRLYEYFNKRSSGSLFCGEEILEAFQCDMLEREEIPLEHTGHEISFSVKPFEIKTIKIKVKG